MRGLQRADHGLFVTVYRRHLRGIAGSGRARGGLAGGPCPAASAGIAVTGVPAATPCDDHGTLSAARVARLVARRAGNPSAPSADSADSAIIRVIGAASALSARDRGYGKEKVYGSIP